MDFSLTDDTIDVPDMFRDFCARKKAAKVAAHTDEAEEPPRDLLKKAAAQGFLAAMIPEDFGGAALDPLSYALLLERDRQSMHVYRCDTGRTQQFRCSTLVNTATPIKKTLAPKLAEALGAFASTEPDAGTDTSRLATRRQTRWRGLRDRRCQDVGQQRRHGRTLLVVAQTTNARLSSAVDAKTSGIKIGLS